MSRQRKITYRQIYGVQRAKGRLGGDMVVYEGYEFRWRYNSKSENKSFKRFTCKSNGCPCVIREEIQYDRNNNVILNDTFFFMWKNGNPAAHNHLRTREIAPPPRPPENPVTGFEQQPLPRNQQQQQPDLNILPPPPPNLPIFVDGSNMNSNENPFNNNNSNIFQFAPVQQHQPRQQRNRQNNQRVRRRRREQQPQPQLPVQYHHFQHPSAQSHQQLHNIPPPRPLQFMTESQPQPQQQLQRERPLYIYQHETSPKLQRPNRQTSPFDLTSFDRKTEITGILPCTGPLEGKNVCRIYLNVSLEDGFRRFIDGIGGGGGGGGGGGKVGYQNVEFGDGLGSFPLGDHSYLQKKDFFGATYLHYFVARNRMDLVEAYVSRKKMMVEKSAEEEEGKKLAYEVEKEVDKFGISPIHVAKRFKRMEILAYLCPNVVKEEFKISNHQIRCKVCSAPSMVDTKGRTLTHKCAGKSRSNDHREGTHFKSLRFYHCVKYPRKGDAREEREKRHPVGDYGKMLKEGVCSCGHNLREGKLVCRLGKTSIMMISSVLI